MARNDEKNNIMDNIDFSNRKEIEAELERKKEKEAKERATKASIEAAKAKFPDKIGPRNSKGKNTRLQDSLVTPKQAEASRKAEQEAARIAAEKEEREAKERRNKEIKKEKRRREKLEKRIAKLTTIFGISGAALFGGQVLTYNPIAEIKEVPKEKIENRLKDDNLRSKVNLFALNEKLVNEIEEKVLNNKEVDVDTASGLGKNEEINNIEDLRHVSSQQQYAIFARDDSSPNETKYFVTAADKELTKQSTLRSMIISYVNANGVNELKAFIENYEKAIGDKIISIDEYFNMIAVEKNEENLQEELKELKDLKALKEKELEESKKPTMQEKYGGYNIDTILANGGTVNLTMIEKSQEQNQQTKQAQEDTTIYRANVDEEER